MKIIYLNQHRVLNFKSTFMKTKYFKILFIVITVNLVSCKAQTLPLNTLLNDIPANAHVKDLNNELTPYVGIYKTNYQGNEITLYITKVEDKLEESANKNYFLDALVIKYTIVNSSGVILQDTKNFNSIINKISSYRIRSYDNSVLSTYNGTNCGVGWGSIRLKKLNSTQISWDYRPNSIVLRDDCPANADKKVYLPVTKDLIFTKQ